MVRREGLDRAVVVTPALLLRFAPKGKVVQRWKPRQTRVRLIHKVL
jgi:hypothetical protein